MSKTTIKSLYYFFVLIAIGLIFFMSRGSTTDDTSLKTDQKGEVILSLEPDSGITGSIFDRLPSLYRQQLVKTDYAFVAYYTYRVSFDLTSVPEVSKQSLKTRISLPGRIDEVSGGKLKDNKVEFELKLGEKNNLTAQSRQIRWVWIVVSVLVVIAIGVFYFLRRQVEKRKR